MTAQRKPRAKKADFITPDELAAALSALDLRTRLMDVAPQATPEQAGEIARSTGIDATPEAIIAEARAQRARRHRSRAHTPAATAATPRARKISVTANLAVFAVVAVGFRVWLTWSVCESSRYPHSVSAISRESSRR